MNDTKLTYTALALYSLAAAVLFGTLVLISYLPPQENGPMLVHLIDGALGMLFGHILTILNPRGDAPAAAPPVVVPAALPPGQTGWSLVSMLWAVAAIAVGCALLQGCASLTQAGNTAYSVKPQVVDGKATGGCEFSATDGKEYSSRAIAMTTGADGCALMVNEGASSAFQGQAIAGKALSVLPSFAAPVLAPGPAVVVPGLQAKP